MPRRLLRLSAAYVILAVGVALTVRAELGVGPWDVFHQGLSRVTPLSFGMAVTLTGAACFLVWRPLGQRIGIATVANVLLLGPMADLALLAVPASESLLARWQMLVVGTVLIGLGAGAYLSTGLGSGPRDGIMMGLADRGYALGRVRLVMEASALTVGVLLGGTVGVGSVVIGVGIGPVLQRSLAYWRAVDAARPQGTTTSAGRGAAGRRRWGSPSRRTSVAPAHAVADRA